MLIILTTFDLNPCFHIFKVAQNLKVLKLASHVLTCWNFMVVLEILRTILQAC